MKVSWKFYLDKNEKINFVKTFIYRKSFQNNYDSYRVCHSRNMLPFYNYEKLKQISSLTTLVKRVPGNVHLSLEFSKKKKL